MTQQIIALREISVSEMYAADNKYTEKFVSENPDALKVVLFDLGLDTTQHYEQQLNTHRNRFNKVYTGTRFVGLERLDTEWINSGYASEAAVDKTSGSRLLTDLYSQKGLTANSIEALWENEKELEEKDETTPDTDLQRSASS